MYAVITLNGMNGAYKNINNKDIFDGIRLPDGIDRDTLVNRIFIRCEEFSVMHSNINYMHWQILNFFEVHYDTFDRWSKVMQMEYNPIENYDMMEDYSGSGNNQGSNSSTGTDSNTDTTTKAAFNSSSYEPYEKLTGSGSSSMSGTNSGSYVDQHNLRRHGNIGVTTSQQMLESEIEIAKLNLYTYIADLFCDEFCIQVY